MTIRYCGSGGNDGNSGLTWALRKLTLNGVEDTPVAVGDVVYVGPGVYRETLTIDVSGGSVYQAGTVTVTNGSTTVTGAGTAFLANVAVADQFHVSILASGNDGVANGTAMFTSAAGNFQANMIGKVIQINARASYRIGAVAAANSITLVDVHGLGWPAAGAGLTYSVMSGEGHYETASVTNNTNFELVRPWCGPTLTGLAYIAFTPVTYIGDVTGENTDGIGGVVRITGSNNDQVAVRATGILCDWPDYRTFRGFRIDLCSSRGIQTWDSTYHLYEDCTFSSCQTGAIVVMGGGQKGVTTRRCVFLLNGASVSFWMDASVSDSGHIVENCVLTAGGWNAAVYSTFVGGLTIRNCITIHATDGVYVNASPIAGQTTVVNNCVFQACAKGVNAGVLGDLIEDYNNFFLNSTDRTNVAVGAGSVAYASLIALPILYSGFKLPWWFGELSEWSQVRAIAGTFESCDDLQGFVRPVTSGKKSWGAVQFTDMEHDTGTVYAGMASIKISDAGRVQFKVPCTNRTYMVRVRVQREANYAGGNPQIIIKQPGQADRTTTDAGAAGAWNLLEDTVIPVADPKYFFVELVSNNTAAAGNYATFFDNLEIRGETQDPGEFEHWLWERQLFDTLPANTLIVHGMEYRRRRMPGEVSALAEYK